VFGLLALALMPLVLLGGAELGLRLAGYGYSTSFFKPIRTADGDFFVENDKFGLSFFPPKMARSPAPVLMRARKPAGAYRIFILGESAALGDPRPAYGAGRYLQVLLRERFPGVDFEVICVAMTAINSHAILPIARECARHEGDLWIIYMGNNEMVGPFGATTVFGSRTPRLSYVRLGLAIEKTRMGQLLMAAIRKLAGDSKPGETWGGMKMLMEHRVPPDDPGREVVHQNFRKNLDDILRAGEAAHVPMMLCTMAVNLRDCPPFASVVHTNLPASERAALERLGAEAALAEGRESWMEALEKYVEAARIEPQSAELQFRLGNCLLHITNSPAAREHFVRACDLDELPFRADSQINDAVRQTGQAHSSHNLICSDAESLFATNSPTGVPGQESFYDHVHFNFDGNYRLARSWAEQMRSLLPALVLNHAVGDWVSQETCERRLGLTDYNRYPVFQVVLRRLVEPPFVNQFGHTQYVEAVQSQARALRQRIDKGSLARTREIYLEALTLSPGDHRLHENFAEFLEEVGDLPGTLAEWRRVRELIPHHHFAWFKEGYLLRCQGRLTEALAPLRHAVDLRPDLAKAWLELGMIHAVEGKTELALSEYERVRRLTPDDCQVYALTGKALSSLGRRAEAIQSLRRSVQLDPTFSEARCALGEALALDGRVPEARREFEEVIRQKPDHAAAHLNLGLALVQEGQLDNALNEFEEAKGLDPKNKLAVEYAEKLRAQKKPWR
jgi:tetratricopeptide (TPR) repeat protein